MKDGHDSRSLEEAEQSITGMDQSITSFF